MIIKKMRTTVLIDNDKFPRDDWEFIRKRHYKPTNLLRAKIKELREREEGKPDADMLLKNVQKLQAKMSEIFDFLNQKGLLDEFIKKQKN